MTLEIIKPPIGGLVRAIPSKSQAHRLLICAALSDAGTYIGCGGTSDDIDTTVGCLESLGARIRRDGAGFQTEPIALPISETLKTLDCAESGSTLRFMLPVCCALGAAAEFVMRGRLSERPMSHLSEQLSGHGCEITAAPGILRCSGKLEGGDFALPGNVSSQYISGLLLALPLLGADSAVTVSGKVESASYIGMTLDALSMFGIRTGSGGGRYAVRGGQGYRSPGKADVEGDWSNAAFWLCAGAIGGDGVTCAGLNAESRQGDRVVAQLLELFGAGVTYAGDRVTVTPGRLHGIQIDAGDIPDLVPALSVVAAVAGGRTEIRGAARLRLKESDRLRSVTETLRGLGADVAETGDGLTIVGKPALDGGSVSAFGDHRIAMMAAIASGVCGGPVTIGGAEAVNKSYPGFFRDFEALGGVIKGA